MPLNIVHYYLPGHLVFASISLALGSTRSHAIEVMEALILPPSDDEAQISEIDEQLCSDAPVSSYKESRVAMYRRMTKQQRVCVARYLSLYVEHRPTELRGRALELYLTNRDMWEHSLLPDSST